VLFSKAAVIGGDRRTAIATDYRGLRESDRKRPLSNPRVAASIGDLVDIQDQRDEQSDRKRRDEWLPRQRAAGLDHVTAEQHERPEPDRHRDRAETALDEF